MADPRQGRAGQGGYSPRLGRRDPRLRTNAAGAVSDQDLDNETLERDAAGRTKIKAAANLPVIPDGSTLAQVIAAHNQLVKALKGLK